MVTDPRRGTTLLEVVVASVLLGTMLVVSVQALGWTARARRSVDQRAVALQEAANLLDELTGLPWPEVTPERLKACRLSLAAAEGLPEGTLEAALSEIDGVPAAKRIAVTVGWRNSSGLIEGPVRLTAWIYRRTSN